MREHEEPIWPVHEPLDLDRLTHCYSLIDLLSQESETLDRMGASAGWNDLRRSIGDVQRHLWVTKGMSEDEYRGYLIVMGSPEPNAGDGAASHAAKVTTLATVKGL